MKKQTKLDILLFLIAFGVIMTFGFYATWTIVDVWQPDVTVAEHNAEYLADMQELSMGGY